MLVRKVSREQDLPCKPISILTLQNSRVGFEQGNLLTSKKVAGRINWRRSYSEIELYSPFTSLDQEQSPFHRDNGK